MAKRDIIESESPTAPESMPYEDPVGPTVEAVIAERSRRSAAYRAESARLAEYEAIARLVIMQRGRLNLTQAELARRMGTTASVISRIESGMRPTTTRTLRRLFEALDGQLIIGIQWGCASNPARDWFVVS